MIQKAVNDIVNMTTLLGRIHGESNIQSELRGLSEDVDIVRQFANNTPNRDEYIKSQIPNFNSLTSKYPRVREEANKEISKLYNSDIKFKQSNSLTNSINDKYRQSKEYKDLVDNLKNRKEDINNGRT